LRRNQAPERNNTRRVKFIDLNASAREFFNHRFGCKLVICRRERVERKIDNDAIISECDAKVRADNKQKEEAMAEANIRNA
jgi:hypothetical protein